MQYLPRILIVFIIALLLAGCSNEAPVPADVLGNDQNVLTKDNHKDDDDKDDDDNKKESHADVMAFQPAGSLGGGLLTPGTFFPPTNHGESKLRRDDDELSYKIKTSGLPPGAYTNWWVIINNPEECDGECGLDDVFGNPATNSTAFWATGGIVKDDGVGKFRAEIHEGQPSKGPDGFLFGNGLQNAQNAEVHLIIKYHGPASDDPVVLFDQTHTLLGSCASGANGTDSGQCFDPQVVIHRL